MIPINGNVFSFNYIPAFSGKRKICRKLVNAPFQISSYEKKSILLNSGLFVVISEAQTYFVWKNQHSLSKKNYCFNTFTAYWHQQLNWNKIQKILVRMESNINRLWSSCRHQGHLGSSTKVMTKNKGINPLLMMQLWIQQWTQLCTYLVNLMADKLETDSQSRRNWEREETDYC